MGVDSLSKTRPNSKSIAFRIGMLSVLVLSMDGCSMQEIAATPDEVSRRSVVKEGQKVRIALASGIAERIEDTGCDASSPKIITGKSWQDVFIGGSGDPVLTIQKSFIECKDRMRVNYTYRVQATVEFKGEKFPLEAVGQRSALSAVGNALRESIELTIVDIAAQADRALAKYKQPVYQ